MPLSTEQQCIMGLGEWEQYCSGIKEDVKRANHLMSWDYVLPGCEMRLLEPAVVIDSMIKEGGWCIIGDSLAREVHSLSPKCIAFSLLIIKALVRDFLSTISSFKTSRRSKFRTISLVPDGYLPKLGIPTHFHSRSKITFGREIRPFLRRDQHAYPSGDILSERFPSLVRAVKNDASSWRRIQQLHRI